jgi:hypothetical protein
MGSSSKRQQTHAKRAREQALRERRERKDAKKAARRAGLTPEEYDASTGEYGATTEGGDASPTPTPGEDGASTGTSENV